MTIVGCSPGLFQALAFLSLIPLAAQDTGLQARQLYYKAKSAVESEQAKPEPPKTEQKSSPAKSTTSNRHRLKTNTVEKSQSENKVTVEPNPLGLKYTVEQVDGAGKAVQVDPDKTFSTGDAIRLRMEVNSDAYVYLLARGASGEGSFLFPQSGEDNRLRAFQSIQVPAEPGDPIRFDQPAGTETLYILVSRTPIAELESLLHPRGNAQPRRSAQPLMAANIPGPQLGDLVGHAEQLQSRDLVRGKVLPATTTGSGSGAVNEHAVYAVNVSSTPGAQVEQKLELKHR